MPKKPCPRAVAVENRAFLRHLAATGNAHEAARRLSLSRTRFTKRRAADPVFATKWAQAIAIADAALIPPRNGEVARRRRDGGGAAEAVLSPTTVRLSQGRHQLRRPGGTAKLTPAHAGRFLLALSATANVRLAAAAAGLSHATFYGLKRRDPAFAREWRAALEQGYQEVKAALVAGFAPDAYEHDDWSHNEPPAIPPMTAAQALQLLHLHEREVTAQDAPPQVKRRRGEPQEVYWTRVAVLAEARLQRERDKFRRAEAARAARGEPRWAEEAGLPDLSQVTGWSKANPAGTPHHPDRALFGGWRIDDWRERRGRDP